MPSGWARCTSAPAAARVSAAQYHPYVASRTTFGCWPARAISLRNAAALLVIFAVPRRRPSSVIRTSTLRRRCRSMPTTCRPSYAVSIGGLPFLVETDALQLPASAREREAPLLHRIRARPARPAVLGAASEHAGPYSRPREQAGRGSGDDPRECHVSPSLRCTSRPALPGGPRPTL